MATKVQKQLAAARRARSTAARRMREKRGRMERTALVGASGYALGMLEQRGLLDRVPTVAGIPRVASVAVIGHVGSMFAKGKLATTMEALGDSALAIAAYQGAAGGTVSGVSGYGEHIGHMHDTVAGFMDDVAGELVSGYDDDDDDDELVGEDLVQGYDDDGELVGIDH